MSVLLEMLFINVSFPFQQFEGIVIKEHEHSFLSYVEYGFPPSTAQSRSFRASK